MDTQLPRRNNKLNLEESELKFREDLTTRRLYALFEENTSFESTTLLSNILKCTQDELIQALDVLLALNFIKFSNKGYVRTSDNDYKHAFGNESKAQRLESHRERLVQITNELPMSHSFSDVTLVSATDLETYLWYCDKLKTLNDEFLNKTKGLKNKPFMLTSVAGVILDTIQEGAKI